MKPKRSECRICNGTGETYEMGTLILEMALNLVPCTACEPDEEA